MASLRVRSQTIGLSLLSVDRASPDGLRRQVYVRLRDAIVSGELKAGTRLPSTRAAAEALAVSRNTVADVFAQLIAEGYLIGKHGSGTYVAPGAGGYAAAPVRRQPNSWERASARGKLLSGVIAHRRPNHKAPVAFQPGIPALDHFPFETWSHIAAKIMRRPPPELVSYGDPAGYGPLRSIIAAHLRSRKGIACSDEQIVIVGGTQQALDLICRLALDPGDRVWVEDPGSRTIDSTYAGAGAHVVPVPVDAHGISVERGRALAPDARLAHVTSAHQWPLGVTMSAARRAELLRWAVEADAWIVEDEYDGEFRYDGSEPVSIKTLDTTDRVLWAGSFSATMFPALRIGYLVVPPPLVEAFIAAKLTADRQTSTLEQAMLAEFMYDGHYARHLRRMRDVYGERHARLVAALRAKIDIDVVPAQAGLHLVLKLAPGTDDRAISERAAAAGIIAPALSRYAIAMPPAPGLLLGFGIAHPAVADGAVAGLARCMPPAFGVRAPLPRAARDVPG